MTAGLPPLVRSFGRAPRALLVTGLIALLMPVNAAFAGTVADRPSDRRPDRTEPVDEVSPVKKAEISQAGRSLIFQIRTDRQIALSDLERRPDLGRPKARYLCFEMTHLSLIHI